MFWFPIRLLTTLTILSFWITQSSYTLNQRRRNFYHFILLECSVWDHIFWKPRGKLIGGLIPLYPTSCKNLSTSTLNAFRVGISQVHHNVSICLFSISPYSTMLKNSWNNCVKCESNFKGVWKYCKHPHRYCSLCTYQKPVFEKIMGSEQIFVALLFQDIVLAQILVSRQTSPTCFAVPAHQECWMSSISNGPSRRYSINK